MPFNCQLLTLMIASCCVAFAVNAPPPPEDKPGLYHSEAGKYTVETNAKIILKDAKRNKELQVRVSFPKEDGKYPVIVWSHGMYGSKDGYQPLVKHWVSHGYVVIQPTHSDSLSLMSQEERRKALSELKRDLTQDWMSRPRDVQFVLDSLDTLAKEVPGLAEKLDRTRIGMGGHSFGAFTTQLVAGTEARTPGDRQTFADPRPQAFLVLSGNGTSALFDQESFKGVKRPTLFLSGTNDKGRRGEEASWRKDAFTHAAPGDKFLVWIEGAYHDFGGISGAPAAFRRAAGDNMGGENKEHLELVRSASLAFWDAYLKEASAAKEYLARKEIEKSKIATLTSK
jgi:predicted dienelactone hydrolase